MSKPADDNTKGLMPALRKRPVSTVQIDSAIDPEHKA